MSEKRITVVVLCSAGGYVDDRGVIPARKLDEKASGGVGR